MTCQYSDAEWRDLLYNAVRGAPGGVVDAARFLTERRGRSIHAETLRAKLRGVDGDSPSMEMAELLTEWLQEMRQPEALAWLHAFNKRFGLVAGAVGADSVEGAAACAVTRLRDRLLRLSVAGGRLTELGMLTTSDGAIDSRESDVIEAQAMVEVRMLMALITDARLAAGKPAFDAAQGG